MAKKYGPGRFEFEAGKRNYAFTTKIDEFVLNTQARLLAVVKKSIADTVEDSQVPTAKGGKMRVKTGFLRSSGLSSLEGPPMGPGRGDKDRAYNWSDQFLNITLAKMKIGDTFYWGWTANYAKYREAFDGFLESSLMNWQSRVDRAVEHFRNKDMRK